MTQEVFLQDIMKLLNVEQLQKEDRLHLWGYLKGETELLELPRMNQTISYFAVTDIKKQMYGQHDELARRGLVAAIRLNAERVREELCYTRDRYKIYKALGVEEDLVIEDVIYHIKRQYQFSIGTLYSMVHSRLTEYEKDKDASTLGTLLDYYGEQIKAYIEDNELRETHLEQCIVLRALFVLCPEKSPLSQEEAIKKLEVLLLKAVTSIYKQEQVNGIVKKYDRTTLLKDVSFKGDVKDAYLRKMLTNFSYIVGIKCYQYSALVKELLILQVLLEGPVSSGMIFSEELETWDLIMKELELPMNYRLYEYSHKMMMERFEWHGAWYANKIYECCQKDPVCTKKAFEQLVEDESIGAIALYSLLKKYSMDLEADYLSKVEEISREKAGMQGAMALLELSEEARNYVVENLTCVDDLLAKCQVAEKLFYTQMEEGVVEYLTNIVGSGAIIEAYVEWSTELDTTAFTEFVKKHLDGAEQILEAKLKEKNIVDYVKALYTSDLGMPYSTLAKVFNHKQKSVINFMENFAADQEDRIRPYFEELKKQNNKNMLEALARLEKKWDKDRINVDHINNISELEAYVDTIYDKENVAKIPYKDELVLDSVRDQDGHKVSARVVEYYLSEYMLLKDVYVIKVCEQIKGFLNAQDIREVTRNLYHLWLAEGASAKEKNIVLLYALNGTAEDMTILKKQIDTWTENSRGALAAFAVRAMAMNGGQLALMLTDGIGQKYKNKQVRRAAQEAMDEVAKVRGLSKEALADKIIPHLGFNHHREMVLDYGTRSFKAILTLELDIVLQDETGKKLKNLPKPNAKDDLERATEAKEQLKGLKKQVKTIINIQKQRLEKAMMTGRVWTREAWQALFVENPIMNSFAMSLIWIEQDQAGNMLGTFRYMEDGSFNTIDEEEYEFGINTTIALAHPIDLDADTISAWKEQLEDYEVKQAFTQLDLPVYTLTEQEKQLQVIQRFEGIKVYFGTIRSITEKYDWKKTSIGDGAGYSGYYYEDETTGVGVQLSLDFVYVGMEASETVGLKEMLFYKAGTVDYGSYYYDEIDDTNRIAPKDVPDKLLSYALMIGELIKEKQLGEE